MLTNQKNRASHSKLTGLKPVLITMFVVGCLAAGFVVFWYFVWEPTDLPEIVAERGQMGDFFGGILNSTFGFLGLIALLFTLWVQHQELQMSREELKLSRQEFARSADALERNQEAAEKQANLLDDQLKHVTRQNRKQDLVDVIRLIREEIEVILKTEIAHWSEASARITSQELIDRYNQLIDSGERSSQEFRKVLTHGKQVHLITERLGDRIQELGTYLTKLADETGSTTEVEFFFWRYRRTAEYLQDSEVCSNDKMSAFFGLENR